MQSALSASLVRGRPSRPAATVDWQLQIYQCKGCLTCVQNCTKNILTRVVNPEYERLGDGYYTPDIVLTTWYQAETGAVPVSGCGYGGPFSGKGFDSMWTDMSEIVRPTRDGIHGREYINTGVDIGRKRPRLSFDGMNLLGDAPPLIQSPLPLMFGDIPAHWRHDAVMEAILSAAADLGIFAVLPLAAAEKHARTMKNVVPLIDKQEPSAADAAMVIVQDSEKVADLITALKKENSKRIVAVRMNAGPAAAQRVVDLARQGVEVVNLLFDRHGMEPGAAQPRHVRDAMRETHKALVKEGIRDEITLVASGGIALPEHMAKAIICGADLHPAEVLEHSEERIVVDAVEYAGHQGFADHGEPLEQRPCRRHQEQPLGAAVVRVGTALDQAAVAQPVDQPGQRDRLQVEHFRQFRLLDPLRPFEPDQHRPLGAGHAEGGCLLVSVGPQEAGYVTDKKGHFSAGAAALHGVVRL